MNDVQAMELCLGLLRAETEQAVDTILQEAGYFEHNEQDWLPLGDDDNNWTTIGNQNTNPTGALVEKFTNCVDAMLIAGQGGPQPAVLRPAVGDDRVRV